MRLERVVIDTSVLISAALFAMGKPAAVVTHVRLHVTLVLSRETYRELAGKVILPKFDRYLRSEDKAEFLTDIAAIGDWCVVTEKVAECRDPKDNIVLATALSGRADVIVTGDGDLLCLDPFRGIRILSPAAFLDALRPGAQ